MPTTGTRLLPLGTHRLRDIAANEAISQLLTPSLPSSFPPLSTLDVAFRRGIVRAARVGVVVLAIMAGLLWNALSEARRARLLLAQAYEERGVGRLEQGDARGLLFLLEAKKIGISDSKLAGWYGYFEKPFARAGEERSIGGARVGMDLVDRVLHPGKRVAGERALRFSPDGRRLLAASQQVGTPGNMQLWDVAAGRCLRSTDFDLGGAPVRVEWSPSGRWIAIGAVNPGEVKSTFGGRMTPDSACPPFITSIKKVVAPWTLTLMDAATGRTARVPLPQGEALGSMAFSPDSSRLAGAMVRPLASSGGGAANQNWGRYATRIVQWDVPTRRLVGPRIKIAGVTTAVTYSSEGRRLIAVVTGSGTARRDMDARIGQQVSSTQLMGGSSWYGLSGLDGSGARFYTLSLFIPTNSSSIRLACNRPNNGFPV